MTETTDESKRLKLVGVLLREAQVQVLDDYRWEKRTNLSAIFREALADYFSARGVDFPEFGSRRRSA